MKRNKKTNLAAVVFIQSNSAKRMEHSGNYEVISTANALKAVEIAVRSEREKAAELFVTAAGTDKELAPTVKKMFIDTLEHFYDKVNIDDPQNKAQDEE